MKIITSDKELPLERSGFDKSVFLAGPTPRTKDIVSWRKSALNLLESFKFDGTVFVPERENWVDGFDYDTQVTWELDALSNVTKILFWVPRSLPKMLGLTTNTEFGLFLTKGNVIYGRPEDAEKCRYLDFIYEDFYRKKPHQSLSDMLQEVVEELNND